MPGSSKKTAVARVTRQQGGRVGGHEDIDAVEMGCQYPGWFLFLVIMITIILHMDLF